jgi:hypothetical protein
MSTGARYILHASLEAVLRFEGAYGDISGRPGREAQRKRKKGLLLAPALERFIGEFEPTRFEDAAIGWQSEDVVRLLRRYGRLEVDDLRRRMTKKDGKSVVSAHDISKILDTALLYPLFDGEWEEQGEVHRRDPAEYPWSTFRFHRDMTDQEAGGSSEYAMYHMKLRTARLEDIAHGRHVREKVLQFRRSEQSIDRYFSASGYKYWEAATDTYQYLSRYFLLDDFAEGPKRLADLVHIVRDFLPIHVREIGAKILSVSGRKIVILREQLDKHAEQLPAFLVGRPEPTA